jgi:transposase
MKYPAIRLPEHERLELERLVHSGTSAARTQIRARVLLLSDHSQGVHHPQVAIADAAMTTVQTIIRIRQRYREGGLSAALYDKPRPGGPPKVTGDIEAKLVALACSTPPDGRKRWTLRLLANRMVLDGHVESLSHVAVYDRLKKTN